MSDASQENQFIVARKEVSLTQCTYPEIIFTLYLGTLMYFWKLTIKLITIFSQALYFYQVDGRGPCLAFEGISDIY